jgi:hypothetical protein
VVVVEKVRLRKPCGRIRLERWTEENGSKEAELGAGGFGLSYTSSSVGTGREEVGSCWEAEEEGRLEFETSVSIEVITELRVLKGEWSRLRL